LFVFFAILLVEVCSQPSSPTITKVLNAGNSIGPYHVWTTTSLVAGDSYSISWNTAAYVANSAFTVAFTTSVNVAAPWGAALLLSNSSSTELAANPAPSMTLFAGPTGYGTTALPKATVYFNGTPTCNNFTVAWTSFQVCASSGHSAEFWNGSAEARKRAHLENRNAHGKRGSNFEKRTCPSPLPALTQWCPGEGYTCPSSFGSLCGCLDHQCQQPTGIVATNIPSQYTNAVTGNTNPGVSNKRTSYGCNSYLCGPECTSDSGGCYTYGLNWGGQPACGGIVGSNSYYPVLGSSGVGDAYPSNSMGLALT